MRSPVRIRAAAPEEPETKVSGSFALLFLVELLSNSGGLSFVLLKESPPDPGVVASCTSFRSPQAADGGCFAAPPFKTEPATLTLRFCSGACPCISFAGTPQAVFAGENCVDVFNNRNLVPV